MENSFSLYIHIPFCISKCRYCDFFSVACNVVSDDYVAALCRELKYRLSKYPSRFLKSIYIGGGTPSLLHEKQLVQIFDSIKEVSKITEDCEITIEVNPDDVTEKLLESFEKSGINRISCGIQSMTDNVLKYAGRRASREVNLEALKLLSKWKYKLSLDLICGLPEENADSFVYSLKEVISYNPDHISMYSLTFEDETPFGQLLEKGEMNYDFEFSDELWLKGKDILEENGYCQYEVSNFARKGFECRHNLSYWNHVDYIGCGSGGTGTVYYEDGTGNRWTNSKNIQEYIQFWTKNDTFDGLKLPEIAENISLNDSVFEFFMMGLRKLEGIKKSDFEKIFNLPFPKNIEENFEKWKKQGLCEIISNKDDVIFTLGEKGILFLNRFLEEII